MIVSDQYQELSAPALSRRVEEEKAFYLIDIVGGDHFDRVHLPHALKTCLFEVTFIDQVKAITEDKDAEIALYGSNASSMDAITAAGKLGQAGYKNIYVLKGGIEAWRTSGLPLKGNAIGEPDDPQTQLSLKPDDRRYLVDADRSIIQWTGRNPNSSHYGTVNITRGEIESKDGNIVGAFEIDMDSINDQDLEGNELKPVLMAHLKSDDFFLTKLFPTASFEIVNARPIQQPFLTIPNFNIDGNLILRGVKVHQEFMATVTRTPDNGLVAEAHYDIDRTKWGIIYGSARFFEHLGMHLVFDLISIQIKIFAS